MMKKIKIKTFQRPRGTHDILPEAGHYWKTVREKAEELSAFYGFRRIETPHFEDSDLFCRGVGTATDIVEKQMYSFKTRGDDHLTLRPEATAPVVRAYIENGMFNEPHPVKLWYEGSFFRHESPQKGRFREFHQWGLEALGEEGPVIEAEIIQVMSLFFREIGIVDSCVELNSIGCRECRSTIRSQIMGYYRSRSRKLCVNCRRRIKENYFRIFDCKEEKCVQLRENAPQIIEHICDPCKNHFRTLLEFMEEVQVPYTLNPYLVRGLDYYTRTVFEFFVRKPVTDASDGHEEGAQGNPEDQKNEDGHVEPNSDHSQKHSFAIAGGGRYDGLAELLGGRPTPAAGGSVGLERVIEVMRQQKIKTSHEKSAKIYLVQLGDLAKRKSLKIIEQFRQAGIPIRATLAKDSVKSQFTLAGKVGAEFVLVFGQKEALDEEIIIREMNSGIQETVPLAKLIESVKRNLKK
ncbi:MAG: histidine--tRNA ligase [Patescibacteria group bacterium]